jgi:hypothetical protein
MIKKRISKPNKEELVCPYKVLCLQEGFTEYWIVRGARKGFGNL